MAEQGFLILSDADLAALGIGPRDVVAAIEAAFAALASGRLRTVPKSALSAPAGRHYMTTLATSDDPPLTVVKSVMVSPRNPTRGLGGVEGSIFVQDAETGLLRAVMQAGWVTEARTAGLSAIAARRLADPASRIAAFIGCGAQARAHLAALAEVFPLREIRVAGRGRDNVARLCAEAAGRGISASARGPDEALDGAGIVVSSVTLDPSVTPFLDARRLAPGSFAAILDQALPWIPESMSAFATLIVDDRAQEEATAHPMVDPARISGDLADLVAGEVAPRSGPGARSAFVSRGLGLGDFALAALALVRAERAGIGRRAAFGS